MGDESGWFGPQLRRARQLPAADGPGFFSFIPITTQGGNAVAVDSAGSVYVGGVTNTVDFPTTPGALQSVCNCISTGTNGFVSKLSADGSHLLYSTYLGGTSGASVQAIAIDLAGDAWVAAPSPAPFPTTPGSALPNAPGAPGFLAKVNATGTALQYSTYLTASSVVSVEGLSLNPDNTITVAALTSGTAGIALGFDSTASSVLLNAPLASEQGDWGFAGNAGSGFTVSGSSGIVTGFKPFAASVPAIYALTDSASVTTRDHFAPGELVTFYGANLGPAAGQAFTPVNGFVPTALAGTQVLFDGVPAPLLYVSSDQVNAVVPYEVFEHDQVTVQVTAAAGNAAYTFPVVPSDPVIVQSGPKTTLAFNQDGSVNSESNPAAQGSVVTILASGGGMMVSPGGITGEITSELSQLELPVSVVFQLTSNTYVNAQIDYAGPVPTLVSGMLQINFTVPAGVETGPGFVLKIGDSASVPAFISVR